MANQSFAEAMSNLEQIVRRLEQGEVQLEEAIDLYKKGMELSKECHEKLAQAEQQLISIVEEDGSKQPFSTNSGE